MPGPQVFPELVGEDVFSGLEVSVGELVSVVVSVGLNS